MIGAIGLHMGIVGIQAQADCAAQRIVLPARAAVAVPKLGRHRIKGHALEADAKAESQPQRRGLSCQARTGRHTQTDLLRADGIGVAAIGESADAVVGQAVGGELTVGA